MRLSAFKGTWMATAAERERENESERRVTSREDGGGGDEEEGLRARRREGDEPADEGEWDGDVADDVGHRGLRLGEHLLEPLLRLFLCAATARAPEDQVRAQARLSYLTVSWEDACW